MFKKRLTSFTNSLRNRVSKLPSDAKFYDDLLDQLVYEGNPCPIKAWKIFSQQFIDDIANTLRSRKQWTGVPFLNAVDFPCGPGSVIMLREQSFVDRIFRRTRSACVAGTMADFVPHELRGDQNIHIAEANGDLASHISPHPVRLVYQARKCERAVVITAHVQERRYLVVDDLRHRVLDLDNFDSTGYCSDRCYVITSVMLASPVTIEVTLDGDVFHEHTYNALTPVCFQAMKARLVEEGRGEIRYLKEVRKVLPVKLTKRRGYQNFFNAFIPNQNKLGHSVGDCPAIIDWQEPMPVRTFRPRFLPRHDRPATDVLAEAPHDLDLMHLVNRRRGRVGGRAEEARGRAAEAGGRAEEANGRVEEARGAAYEASGRQEEARGRADEANGRAEEARGGPEEAGERVDAASGRADVAGGRAEAGEEADKGPRRAHA